MRAVTAKRNGHQTNPCRAGEKDNIGAGSRILRLSTVVSEAKFLSTVNGHMFFSKPMPFRQEGRELI
ncbi:hypothetical protein ABIE48_006315 [Paenibacillus sp. OAE614]